MLAHAPAQALYGKIRQLYLTKLASDRRSVMSVGAAKHLASTLAACQHGSRPQQLGRIQAFSGEAANGPRPLDATKVETLRFRYEPKAACSPVVNAGDGKTGRIS